MQITFYGQSAFCLEAPGAKILIDPYLSQNPLSPVKPEQVTGVTHILVTHGHYDHIGDTVALARQNGALVVANGELCSYFKAKGLKTHVMHFGSARAFDFGTVQMVPALHGSSFTEGGQTVDGGQACGFVLQLEGKRIYHAGDTALIADMGLLEKIDLALLPIGGHYTMDIHEALRAVGLIHPAAVIPMHYNTFDEIRANPRDFVDALPAGVGSFLLAPGESLAF